MAEQFNVAALRHLATADQLERKGRLDDAAYHYGVAGEAAVKEAFVRAGIKHPRKHWDPLEGKSLRHKIESIGNLAVLLRNGRLGGVALADDLDDGKFSYRFDGWSLDIRYAHTDHCPVDAEKLAAWKDDAALLVNNGGF